MIYVCFSEELAPFSVACEENTNGLLKEFYEHPRVSTFLSEEDIHIPIFPSVIENAAENLKYTFDLDGVVVLLSDVSCIKAGVHYMSVGRVDVSKVSNHWHILKKHLDLRRYSTDGVNALQKCMGMVLALVDGGYFLNMTCVPNNPDHAHPMFKKDFAVKGHAVGMLNAVLQNFTERLKMLSPKDLERPSIMKSQLGYLTRMNVLHSDQKFVLEVFNQALSFVNNDVDMHILMSLSKFGQKDDREFNLGALVDPDGVMNVSYHAACNVCPVDPSIDLFWSRFGLQEVVGRRGTLFPVYSMAEASNYQSNIDNKDLDVDGLLRQVLRDVACTVNFVQLYATTPHCHHSQAVSHPVSRVITLCDLHNEKHRSMLHGQAARYLMHMEDLSKKTVCRVFVRLEAVFLARPDYGLVVNPRNFFIPSALDYLLETVPMIVPFKDNADGLGLRNVVHTVASHLTQSLGDVFAAKKGMGGFFSSWRSFQLELALEEFFFGRVVGKYSKQYAAALGVCPSSSNSMTRMRGFLGLSHVGSASVGESPPPLEIWLHDDVQKARVERIFALSDCVTAGQVVVGEQLLRILMSDLYGRNDRLPTESLQGPERPIGNLVGCRNVGEFSREVCTRKGFGYPLTFERALKIVTSYCLDPVPCLESALSKLKYFPSIRYWDEKRHCKAKWNFKDYVELHKPTEVPSAASRAASYCGDVCARMEELDLTFSRNLRKYREKGMPWMERCIQCLPRGMPQDRVLTALVFLSSVGMIMNGDYVYFEKLAQIERNLPVTQSHLQELGILSKLLLLHSPMVYRFHESVPYKLVVSAVPPVPRVPQAQRRPRASSGGSPVEPDEEEAEEPEEQLVQRIETASVPASMHSRWSDLEMSYVDLNSTIPHSRAYAMYVKRCRENSTPVRTLESFKRKRRRLLAEG